MIDWSKYPNFSKREFDCKETGENQMLPDFLELLQAIRETYGRPMVITSGFRSRKHSIERGKRRPGEHTYGVAADIAISGPNVADLQNVAYNYGVRRFGLKQHGSGKFLHIGIGDRGLGFAPSTWTYDQ